MERVCGSIGDTWYERWMQMATAVLGQQENGKMALEARNQGRHADGRRMLAIAATSNTAIRKASVLVSARWHGSVGRSAYQAPLGAVRARVNISWPNQGSE